MYNHVMQAYEDQVRRGGDVAVMAAARFLMGNDPVHQTLHVFARRLQDLQIPYAVVGGMALVAHGYLRTTEDVDLLVTTAGLDTIHDKLNGLGYISSFPTSRNLRDTDTGVRIDFVVTGQYPGDGKPKPVAFPDPALVAIEMGGIRYVSLPRLVELKLASGMTNPARLRDLADVQELIRILQLRKPFADGLDPYVRPKFHDLWHSVDQSPLGP